MNSNIQATERNMKDSVLIKRLFKYTKGYRLKFLLALIIMGLMIGCELVIPFIYGRTIKILGEDQIDFMRIVYLLIIVIGIMIGQLVLRYIQTLILHMTGNKIIYTIREEVFTKIEKLSIAQLNNIPVGKLVTRVGSDVNTLYELYTSIIINLCSNVFTIVGVFVAMFLLNAKLALFVLIICPFILGISIIFRKFSRKAHRKVRSSISEVNAFLSENISGMKVTQVFNQEDKKYNEFKDRNIRLRKNSLKEIFVFAVFRPSIYVMYILTVSLVLFIGGNEAIDVNLGIMTVGITFDILFTFYQYVERFFNPLQQLAEQFNVLQSSFAAAERVFELLDTNSEIVEKEDAIELTTVKGEIEFKNVWFKYIEDEWILKDVSFKINANDTVAFVGATGSGKTTILSLIVRNYDIQKGQILIDGIDIKDIKIDSLRRNIGQMLQDVFLFSGTILSNIQMREEGITESEVIKAAKYVNADKFIDHLPKKYHEEVRERGNNFSSGQRQLLSFTRTIAHKPSIMILDEATANIDSETEILIQDSLEKMMNIGTMLIVAHRLSTIQHANKIIVLQKGEIIESGTHQELLKNRGHYYKLYQLQYHHEKQRTISN